MPSLGITNKDGTPSPLPRPARIHLGGVTYFRDLPEAEALAERQRISEAEGAMPEDRWTYVVCAAIRPEGYFYVNIHDNEGNEMGGL